jgi:hypothetical protein
MSDLAKVTFFLAPRLHEDLRIRMHYDGFKTQSDFFRACVVSYLEKDSKFMDFLDHYKQSEKLQSKASIKKSERLRKRGKELMVDLRITEEDLENIFDLIEEELPEL